MALTTPRDRTARPTSTRRRATSGASFRLRSLLAAVAAFCAAALVIPTSATTASAVPAAPDLNTVRKQVQALDRQAAEATEQYNATRVKLASLTVAVKAATARAEQQKQRVDLAGAALGRIAAETYKAGELDGLLLLLDDDPEVLMAASGLRSTLSERRARGVAAMRAEQDKLSADRSAMAEQQRNLSEAGKRLSTEKKQVEGKLAKSRELLSRLDGSQRRALASISRSLDRDALEDLGVQVPASGKLTCKGVGIQAPTAKAAKAIAFACAQIGKPYDWGADGPGSYDCSGLTQSAWEAAGVSLPHNAAMQAEYGTRVKQSDLLPGDLLFFYSPISHDGIYIGKGLMVHAPSSGDVVKIASARLDGRLTAAVRL